MLFVCPLLVLILGCFELHVSAKPPLLLNISASNKKRQPLLGQSKLPVLPKAAEVPLAPFAVVAQHLVASMDTPPCQAQVREYKSLRPQFLSSQPPFVDPQPADYASAPKEQLMMRSIDEKMLRGRTWMLDVIVGLLKKYKVHYWLEAGTLLGAYRSGGFTPWDDDVDLAIPLSFQQILLGPVAREAKLQGITILQLFFPPSTPAYEPVVAYIQRHAPKVFASTNAADPTRGTQGYFVQAYFQNLKLDLWQAFPVVLDNMVMYSTGVAGSTVFSKEDIYPLKECQFEGKTYSCPQRTHKYLAGTYGDISEPPAWRTWWDPKTCTWNKAMVQYKKAVSYFAKDQNFARIIQDSSGDVHLSVPAALQREAVVGNFWQHPLGAPPPGSIFQASGYGIPSSVLVKR